MDIAKEKHDKRVILIKACSICFEWFTTNDIVVTSCGHMYHLFCLFIHLQTSITCVVKNFLSHVLHPYQWQNMGIVLCKKSKNKLQWTCILCNNDNNGFKRRSITCNKKVKIYTCIPFLGVYKYLSRNIIFIHSCFFHDRIRWMLILWRFLWNSKNT